MATNNAINLQAPGVVSYNGTGTFTGSVITQHDVLVAGASNAIVSISPSTAGFVLTSNGTSADPSFQANPGASGFTSVINQVFTSSGTYTPTTGMVYCQVFILGGGAGGQPRVSLGSGASNGGGAGEYAQGIFSAATIGGSQTVTIGAGGASNTNGGTSSLGSLISCNGGQSASGLG